MTISKQVLRRRILRQRQAMTGEAAAEKSLALCRMVLSSPQYQSAKTLYAYLPFRNEIQLLPLLHQALADGKQVALPKCYGREMQFIGMTDFSQIQYSAFGAPEPAANAPVVQDTSALVIVPGLAFDRRGYRIGYGGGYYDRFLAREPEHPTIALCYDFQLFPRLETEAHDIPVDIVFSI